MNLEELAKRLEAMAEQAGMEAARGVYAAAGVCRELATYRNAVDRDLIKWVVDSRGLVSDPAVIGAIAVRNVDKGETDRRLAGIIQ